MKHTPTHFLTRLLSITAVSGAVFITQAKADTESSEIGWYMQSNGMMYMAMLGINTTTGQLTWNNSTLPSLTDGQLLLPTTQAFPGTYYASNTSALANGAGSSDPTVEPAAWASVLNPSAHGGQDLPSSRWFGFSLTGTLKNMVLDTENHYAIAIQLTSITLKNTSTVTNDVSVYYYNNGTNDLNTPEAYDSDQVAWDLLTGSNYLIWDGTDFSNMVHPVVLSNNWNPAEYTLNFSVSLVEDVTGDASALVASSITAINGTSPVSLSYNASVVPEPSTYAMLIGGGLVLLLYGRRLSRKLNPLR